LRQAVMVAQIDEQNAAMVANAMAPAGQTNILADIALPERAAGMGAVTMHRVSISQMLENRATQKACPKRLRVYPRLSGAATDQGVSWASEMAETSSFRDPRIV
jgi:hypothetical protein